MNRNILIAGFLVAACVSNAAVIRGASSVLSNTGGEFSGGGELAWALNEAGLYTPYNNGVDDYDAYLGTNPLHNFGFFNQEWFTPSGTHTATVVLDMGADYMMSGMAFWNEDAAGTARVSVTTSLNADMSGGTFQGTLSPTPGSSGVDYGADDFRWTAMGARYVQLDLFGPIDASAWDGIAVGEIAFRTEAVPEPVSMVALGAGLIGLIAKRRRK